ncbi:pyridine nucleotide-disulfide oxidoreductase-domain-containing protein [Paraphysoderma sedebokerense]|nr:pyridine nucleotide-disulfide oxidoreductase-domain-containing protein [Paraphysoderma sedebokerense]KAI9139700.1 pyridine nucleotide-disulfide oxidoreductase-domain-containing protein [Paraphysoderma sedebokerense]
MITDIPQSPPHSPTTYKACVVGAGPAGLATVANLLDSNTYPILWIDPTFNGGRLQRYPMVPSNTKVSLFSKFAKVSPTLNKLCEMFKNDELLDPLMELNKLPQDKGCPLGVALHMCALLTRHILTVHGGENGKVNMVKGWVKECELVCEDGAVTTTPSVNSKWTIHVDPSQTDHFDFEPEPFPSLPSPSFTSFTSKTLVLCTGSKPRSTSSTYSPHTFLNPNKHAITPVCLDTALNPTILSQTITPEDTVAVVGSSHSAILVLKNLCELPEESRPKLVKNFYRHDLKYAVYMDPTEEERQQGKESWILYDNTGLKGLAADWARHNLHDIESQSQTESLTTKSEEEEAMEKTGSRIPFLVRCPLLHQKQSEKQIYAKELRGVTKIVYAVGYDRRNLPTFKVTSAIPSGNDTTLTVLNKIVDPDCINYNKLTGQIYCTFEDDDSTECTTKEVPLPAFGFGIAFPEQTIDPMGNKEMSVGMWKFMRYLKKSVNAVCDVCEGKC